MTILGKQIRIHAGIIGRTMSIKEQSKFSIIIYYWSKPNNDCLPACRIEAFVSVTINGEFSLSCLMLIRSKAKSVQYFHTVCKCAVFVPKV